MYCQNCNEFQLIISVKYSEVRTPSGLSGSLQNICLRALVDLMKCDLIALSNRRLSTKQDDESAMPVKSRHLDSAIDKQLQL